MKRSLSLALMAFGFAASACDAQVVPSVRIREGANGALDDVEPTITTRITNCISVGLPFGVGAAEFRYNPDDDRDVSLSINWTDDPTEILLAICGFSPLCPAPAVDSCGPEILQRIDYHVLRGGISLYTAAAGGGFSGGASTRRIATGSIVVSDVLEVIAPEPMTLELPILASGDVFGAESFGNPDETWGKAKIEITGSAAGEAIDLRCEVESVSVIPEQCSINVRHTVPLAVGAGTTTFPIELLARVEVDVKATSAGLFGTIVGAATAGANFGDSLRIQRITGASGAPLPPNVIIRSANSGVVFEDTRPRCPADFNRDGSANSQDFFDFLAAFFDAAPSADFNADTIVNSQDFFDFLTAFFAGC